MADDLRHDDSVDGGLNAARTALIADCEREEENCLYTSATFFIWLRTLKIIRACLWGIGAIGSIVSASSILKGAQVDPIVIAALALTGVLMPGLVKALRLDAAIKDYAVAAASFKNLQGEFRRAARVWSNKSFLEFEADARKAIKAMNETRKPSLTPPEWCFRRARKKINGGTMTRMKASGRLNPRREALFTSRRDCGRALKGEAEKVPVTFSVTCLEVTNATFVAPCPPA